MMSFLSSSIMTYATVLAAMAFFTLLERKMLGYAQLRKGPNKVSLMGLPQPMADALKLFTKTPNLPNMANPAAFVFTPMMMLTLALTLWSIAPSASPTTYLIYGIMLFLCISSLSVYTTMMSGWSSNSKYGLLGALRSVAQTISYEVSMALILISLLLFLTSFNLQSFLNSTPFNSSILMPPLLFIWFTTLLAETNRTPFDLAEGESELVSGFNTEYASYMFAFMFMSEYTTIMFMSMITVLMTTFNPMNSMGIIFLSMKTSCVAIMFIMMRATMPRMRYDRLMNLTWMSFLPFSLMMILLWFPLTAFAIY